MRSIFWISVLMLIGTAYGTKVNAQEVMAEKKVTPTEKTAKQKDVALQEIVVKAARVVDKPDGKLIFPSDVQKEHSHSGFSLLSKLTLPRIRVDEVAHKLSAIDLKGEVQVRINGIVANMHDVQALDVASVSHVDYIDSPGVRYGKDIAYVINIHTRPTALGGTLGFNLSQGLTAKHGTNDIYASLNRGKSQFSLFYEMGYEDTPATKYHEAAQYLLGDGSEYRITRQSLKGKKKNVTNVLELKYNLADSAAYAFQASLTTTFDNQPRTLGETLLSESGADETSGIITHHNSKGRDFTPVLDLYFSRQLGKHQSFTTDLLLTHIHTMRDSYDDEGAPYAYRIDGNTYSLIGEAIYENRLRPFTFSAGANVNWKYMGNVYSGDVESVNHIYTSGVYAFAQVKGSLDRLRYVAGFGMSHQAYRQGDYKYGFWLCRPKLTLSYPLFSGWQLRYSFEISQHISDIAMISDTRIRKNSMEWTVGNPSLKPNSVCENILVLSCAKPRLSSDLTIDYRINRHCNLEKYTRTADQQFLYTQANQPHCNMLYVREDARFDLIADHLSLFANVGIYRFFNKGDDYSHFYTACNYGGTLQGYWGPWSMMLNADNGWNFMEGERIGHQGPGLYGSVGYRLGNFDITLSFQNLFMAHPQPYSTELVNSLVRKQVSARNAAMGNLVMIGVAWHINKGKEYHKIQKSIKNKEQDTGILR